MQSVMQNNAPKGHFVGDPRTSIMSHVVIVISVIIVHSTQWR